MARSLFHVVTDDPMVAMRARQFGESCGADVKVYSHQEWEQKEQHQGNVTAFPGPVPSLASGNQPVTTPTHEPQVSNVIPFPTPTHNDPGVEKINDLESKAIENAIHVYKGNLTEAAKALGIGRATLYRKVKQYNIDPQAARRKRAA